MNWHDLEDLATLDAIDQRSVQRPVMIFKHSTRCSISSTALHRLEQAWTTTDEEVHPCWYLDLIRHRHVSNAIADRYGVHHESPQVLVIHEGRCVWSASHFAITYQEVLNALARR